MFKIIFKLLIPLIFRVPISFFSISSMKKNWVEIKKINGNISKSTDGAFRTADKIGMLKLVFASL